MTTKGRLLLLTGPAGAGKSTVAEAWCRRRPRALHIQLDDVRRLVGSGFADPQVPTETQREQYELAATACLLLAKHYLDHGYDVAIDDAFSAEVFDHLWRPQLADLDWRLAVLQPSLEETVRRGEAREKRVKRQIVLDQHAATSLWPGELVLDTTNLSPEEVVDKLERS